MSEWKPLETAPKDGSRFIALNDDGEMFVARYDTGSQPPRLCRRANAYHEPRSFEHVKAEDGRDAIVEDMSFKEAHSKWRNDWVLWSRYYTFSPTHWLSIPVVPHLEG